MMRRTWVSGSLTVLAAITALVATVGWWVHATVLDTDRFMELVEPIVTSPAVGEAVGDRVTDEIFESLEIEERVSSSLADVDDWLRGGLADVLGVEPDGPVAEALPEGPRLSALTPALVAAAHERVADRVTDVVETPRFQALLTQSARTAHVATVAVLREDEAALPESVVVEGDVTLDLRPLVRAAVGPVVRDSADVLGLEGERIPDDLSLDQLSERFGLTVDPDVTTIVVVSEEQLAPWRDALRTIDRLVWLLVGLAIVLAVAAVWTAPRRTTGAAWLGVSVAVALAVTYPLIGWLRATLLDQLSAPGARDTLAAVVDAATTHLEVAAGTIVAVALVVALAGWLADRRALRGGPPEPTST